MYKILSFLQLITIALNNTTTQTQFPTNDILPDCYNPLTTPLKEKDHVQIDEELNDMGEIPDDNSLNENQDTLNFVEDD